MPTNTQMAQELYARLKPDAKRAYVDYVGNRTPSDIQTEMKAVVQADVASFFQPPTVVDAPFADQVGTGLGSTLNCTQGNWTNTPDSKSFQWKKGAANIGTNSASYIVQAADVGATFTCVVTATNIAGSANSTSNAVVVA